jgi:cyanate permease
MRVCIANLFFASVAILSALLARLRHDQLPINAVDLVVLIWFAGAVGLFFRKRLAWIVSLLGVGATACIFAACFVTIVALHIYPNTDDGLFKDSKTAGFVVFALGCFTLLFALSLGLFIGLVKMRKDLR